MKIISGVAVLYIPQCHVVEGGPVPKSLYRLSEEDVERDKDRTPPEETPFTLDGLYHTAHVVRDFPHEVRKTLRMSCDFFPRLV